MLGCFFPRNCDRCVQKQPQYIYHLFPCIAIPKRLTMLIKFHELKSTKNIGQDVTFSRCSIISIYSLFIKHPWLNSSMFQRFGNGVCLRNWGLSMLTFIYLFIFRKFIIIVLSRFFFFFFLVRWLKALLVFWDEP